MSTDSIAGRSTSDIGEEGDPSTGNTERALRLLSEASATLGASLDLETTLDRVARVIVRTLADWCVVDPLEIEVGPVPVHETLAALEPLVAPQVRAKRLEYRMSRARPTSQWRRTRRRSVKSCSTCSPTRSSSRSPAGNSA